MFKFLFGGKDGAAQVKKETQRETVLRAQKELNEVLTTLSPKARITIVPEEGTVTVQLPEQMPDEAKALPAPKATVEAPKPDETKPQASAAESPKPEAPEKPEPKT